MFQMDTKTIKAVLVIGMAIAIAGSSAIGQRRSRAITQISPQQLVADLYRQHKTRSPFFQHQNRSLLDRYFDKDLADLIWNIPDSPGEVGPLDGDPLYNAQDMEIRNFVIQKAMVTDGMATVLVTFTNIGKKQEVKFLLTSRQSAWKIINIKYDDGTDLIGILKSG